MPDFDIMFFDRRCLWGGLGVKCVGGGRKKRGVKIVENWKKKKKMREGGKRKGERKMREVKERRESGVGRREIENGMETIESNRR